VTPPGTLLAAEQSVRKALIDSVPRQQLIEVIAAHLRRAAQSASMGQGSGGAPRDLYRLHLKKVSSGDVGKSHDHKANC
jgi:hypothetical protein